MNYKNQRDVPLMIGQSIKDPQSKIFVLKKT